MDLLVILLAIPLGLVVGGFVTMLVDRVPDRTPLSMGSRCPFCEHHLGVAEVVPVVSWFVRKGRCRHCGDRITPAYPAVELATMGLWVAAAAHYGWHWTLLPPLVLVTAAVALSVIDLYTFRLPNRLVFGSTVLSLVAIMGAAFGLDRPTAIGKALAGMLLYSGILFVLHLISPRSLAFGDVKFALLLGLHLGWAAGSVWVGWTPVFQLVFYVILGSFLMFGVIGLLVAVIGQRLQRDLLPDPDAEGSAPTRVSAKALPFGPAMAVATVAVVFFADSFV
ncbi:MAG: prepilin peptidase [Acidimicrobiales bacterium]